jgi:hypothetical protein
MSLEANKQLAREFIDALSRADTDWVLAHYADDMEMWTAGSLAFLGAFPNGLEFTVKTLTAEEDRVAIEAESSGVHISGKPYDNQYHFLMRIRNGKIVQFKEYLDTQLASEVLLGG